MMDSIATIAERGPASRQGGDASSPLLPPAPVESGTPGSRWRSLVQFLGLALIGVPVGLFLPGLFPEVIAGNGLVMLAGLVLGTWLNVIVHEAGHTLFGMARGMRPFMLGIGPFRFERGADRWRTRRAGGIAGISGFACLLPPERRAQNRLDEALFLLGGPLANLVTAGIVLWIVAVAGMAPGLSAFLVGLSMSALLLGIVNLVPFQTQGWRSDGRGLLDLALGRPDALVQRQLTQLLALSMNGVRPRDWPAMLVPPPPAPTLSPMMAANVQMLRLSRAMDRGEVDDARTIVLDLVSRWHGLPAVIRPHLAVCTASYIARMQPDADLLAAWLPLCEGGLTNLDALRHWLHAEHACLAGDYPRARGRLRLARGELGSVPDAASRVVLDEYFEDMETRLENL